MNRKTKLPNLEDSMSEITSLVEQMEKGNLTLEQSLNSFERGIHLIKHAQKILQEAEQKVQILLQNKTTKEDQLKDYEEISTETDQID